MGSTPATTSACFEVGGHVGTREWHECARSSALPQHAVLPLTESDRDLDALLRRPLAGGGEAGGGHSSTCRPAPPPGQGGRPPAHLGWRPGHGLRVLGF